MPPTPVGFDKEVEDVLDLLYMLYYLIICHVLFVMLLLKNKRVQLPDQRNELVGVQLLLRRQGRSVVPRSWRLHLFPQHN